MHATGGGGGGGYGVEALCPGGNTLVFFISRSVQLYYGIAQCIMRDLYSHNSVSFYFYFLYSKL